MTKYVPIIKRISLGHCNDRSSQDKNHQSKQNDEIRSYHKAALLGSLQRSLQPGQESSKQTK